MGAVLSGLCILAVGCHSERRSGPEPVLVLAAASVTDVLATLRDRYQQATGASIELAFGASSQLAVQIQNGVEADLFLTASEQWADEVERNRRGGERVLERVDLLANRMVVIVPGREGDAAVEPVEGLETLLAGAERLALADPQSVPAGIYARQALERLDLWARVQERVVAGNNVRTALSYVASGAVPVGIVYATDARSEPDVRVAMILDETLHDPIRYPLLLLRHSRERPAAQGFFDYLRSAEAAVVFREHGFAPLTAAEPTASSNAAATSEAGR